MPNPHYQNLLDDRKVFDKFIPSSLKWKDVVHCNCCCTEEEYAEIRQFLTSRRVIEWKKEVERLEKLKEEVGNYIQINSEIKLLQEAIALTEAEK